MSGRGLGYLVAVGIAGGAHLLAFALWPQTPAGGAEAAGAEGAALVSLAGASAQMTELIAAWERPPETAAAPVMAQPEPLEAPPVARAMPDLSARPDLPALALPAPSAPEAPAIRTAPVTPPKPKPAPKPAKAKPAPKAEKPAAKAAPAAPAQAAKGSGGGASAGQSGAAKAATLSKGQVQSLRAEWGARIRARIERKKRYPTGAGGAKGRVTVQLSVGRDGSLRGLGIAQSSGNAALDQAALDAVKRAGTFPAAPKGLSDASYSFALPMSFSR